MEVDEKSGRWPLLSTLEQWIWESRLRKLHTALLPTHPDYRILTLSGKNEEVKLFRFTLNRNKHELFFFLHTR